jgi:hypothetical protein
MIQEHTNQVQFHNFVKLRLFHPFKNLLIEMLEREESKRFKEKTWNYYHVYNQGNLTIQFRSGYKKMSLIHKWSLELVIIHWIGLEKDQYHKIRINHFIWDKNQLNCPTNSSNLMIKKKIKIVLFTKENMI